MVQKLVAAKLGLIALVMATAAAGDELAECRRLAPKYSAEAEVLLPDGSRCDLLSSEYAIEVDWAASKWKESIGQAVLYAIWMDRKPAVLLLVKDAEREKVDLLRCRLVCERLGVKMFVERAASQ